MEKENKNKFLKLYSNLPMSIQDFLASDKMGVIIEDALNLSKVPSEKFSDIMDLITEILCLQSPKEQFRNELEKRLNISPVATQIIDKVIQSKIFEPFSNELEQYKPQPNFPERKKLTEFQEPLKTTIPSQKPSEEIQIKKPSPEQIIPEYSFPEPSEVKIEKPVNKVEELKRIVTPKVSSDQQEKIREKLLAVMQKKDASPKIVDEMRKIFLKPKTPKGTKEEEKIPEKIKIEESAPSKILSGEGKKFKDEEIFAKTEKEKPYILDIKLKEEKEKKEEFPTAEKPIPYKKYKKESPFGEA